MRSPFVQTETIDAYVRLLACSTSQKFVEQKDFQPCDVQVAKHEFYIMKNVGLQSGAVLAILIIFIFAALYSTKPYDTK